MDISISADGLPELVEALNDAKSGITPALLPTMREEGAELQQVWRANARATAGAHGRRYPTSITNEVRLGDGVLFIEAGPDMAKPQGGMGRGFEYGSVKQPPHMDGARAFATRTQPFVGAIEKAVDDLLDEYGL